MREPRRHPVFLTLLVACSLGTSPFVFIGAEPAHVLGIPVWLWWSGAFTAALSCVTAWGILRHWPDEEAPEAPRTEPPSESTESEGGVD